MREGEWLTEESMACGIDQYHGMPVQERRWNANIPMSLGVTPDGISKFGVEARDDTSVCVIRPLRNAVMFSWLMSV